MISDVLLVLAVVGFASLPFLHLLWKSEVEQCRYDLFAVRDKLVLMVAKGTLDRESVIFKHYYQQVNSVLSFAEVMDLEGIIRFLEKNKQRKEGIIALDKQLQGVRQVLQGAPSEVKETIQLYYQVLAKCLLINSNFFAAAYRLSRRQKTGLFKRFLEWIKAREPKVATAFQTITSECNNVGICL